MLVEVQQVQVVAASLVHAREVEGKKWVRMPAAEWNAANEEWSADNSREVKRPARPRGPDQSRGTHAHHEPTPPPSRFPSGPHDHRQHT